MRRDRTTKLVMTLPISVLAVVTVSVSALKAPVFRGKASEQLQLSGAGSGAINASSRNIGAGRGKDASKAFSAEQSELVHELVTVKGASMRTIMQKGIFGMGNEEAFRRVDTLDLPPEVSSLVHLTQSTESHAVDVSEQKGEFSEASLAKARNVLNGMIQNSWIEMDDKVIECKEFEERNRGTIGQVNNDLNRLGSQIADLEKVKSDANNGIEEADASRGRVEGDQETLFQSYEAIRVVNAAELAKRKSDMAVFDFILNMTACKGSSMLQLTAEPLQICDTSQGNLELRFDNPKLQSKLESMMTASARESLRRALSMTESGAISFLQEQQVPGNQTAETPTAPPSTVAPETEPAAEGQWKKCSDGKANCGLLHDTMSLQWGKFKDLVDELQAKMTKNLEEYMADKENLNNQLTTFTNMKSAQMTALGEATSKANADRGESNEKDEQHRVLEKEYKHKMKECETKISEILFTNICAVKKVRNEIMTFSSITPASKIADCDVKDWVPGECSVLCDDSCPQADPYACGGSQTLTREVVVAANSYGIQCPPLSRKKKCNQFKCPVNCALSSWSAWSKCTKECEGGVQGKTRSVIAKPKNGGEGCDTVQEMRSCDTGSCDRDCTLHPWTDWGPCSMACSGGVQTRVRQVLVPIRGGGKCPTKENADRFEKKECNEQNCIGDEVCMAKQDLILALDASGSLKESGFNILRDFTANLTDRYEPSYKCSARMQLAAVLFGNGHLQPDGTITPAIRVSGLTNDTASVKESIQGLTWQRGFTNLAQAFVISSTILQSGGRDDAQSSVLVIWDGKYSFAFETGQKAKELKDKNVQIYMATVAPSVGETELENMQKWVSHPWETNYEHVPGLEALKENMGEFMQKLVAKFCPNSYSPTTVKQTANTRMFMMLREMGLPDENCANMIDLGQFETVEECADAAKTIEKDGFAYCARGEAAMKGLCKAAEAPFEVTAAQYEEWKNAPVATCNQCPNGAFVDNKLYDFYALDPQ